MWRCRAAAGPLDGKMALAIIDGDDNFHLYWKIDDYNVSDGGKLKMEDGELIFTSFDPAGGTGRCKLDWYDGDNDGVMDLVIGTGRRSAIPNRLKGLPMPALGWRTLGTPLFMRNAGTNQNPVFAMPVPFIHKTAGIIQPGGTHFGCGNTSRCWNPRAATDATGSRSLLIDKPRGPRCFNFEFHGIFSDGGAHPTDPSISRSIKRFNSTEYSIGNCWTRSLTNPFTARLMAAPSEMPRCCM